MAIEGIWADVFRVLPPLLLQILYLSPLISVREIFVRKCTESKSPLPFIGAYGNGSLWTLYGILTRDPTVLYANFSGIAVGFLGIIIFHRYTAKKMLWYHVVGLSVVGAAVLSAAIFRAEVAANFIGILGCVMGVVLTASPLATLVEVVKTKDSSSIPFPMSIAGWFNAISWFIYGAFMTEDVLIWGPNVLGFLAASLQIVVYLRYRKSANAILEDEEVGTVGGGQPEYYQETTSLSRKPDLRVDTGAPPAEAVREPSLTVKSPIPPITVKSPLLGLKEDLKIAFVV